MRLHILPLLSFLFVALVVSHAAVPPEIYWKKVLPYTAMPKAVINSLPKLEYLEDKGTSVNVGKGGVHVNTRGPKQGGGTTVDVGPHKGVGVTTNKPNGAHTNVGVGKGGVGVTTEKPGKGGADVGVGKGGVVVRAGLKKKPVYVGVKPGPNPFNYIYAASETQLHDDPTRALFFLDKDMKLGSHMIFRFTQSTNGATFLPQSITKTLPFSSNKMSDIFDKFSIDPNSEEAQIMKSTIKGCESKGIQGEEKYCATSLESMVDYITSILGKNVKSLSTEMKRDDNKVGKYTIDKFTRVTRQDNEAMVCHKQNYPYAIFYCHKTKSTSVYMVSMVGNDGSTAKLLAVCHRDTSAWNPKHLAFQVLKVKPGKVPICHFLPEDHIVWVHN